MTEEKQKDQAQDILKGMFTVTLENGQSFEFKQGTLRQRLETDRVYDAIETADSATELINLVLPVINAQMVESVDLLDLIDLVELMELLAAFRRNATVDLSTKKNLELPSP